MSVELLNIDCMEYMKGVPDKYYSLSIVDPPYGIGEDGGKNRRTISKHNKKNWDEHRPIENYFKELCRVSRNQIIWGANYFVNYLHPSMGWICWDKKLDNSDFSDFELAFTNFDRAAKIFRYSKNGGSRLPHVLADIIHPTQKPVALYSWILKNYAKPGDKILDTHLGSGSSAIAAHKLGFDFVGTEIDKDYYEAALKRYKKEIAMPLFD